MICKICGRNFRFDRAKGHRKNKCNSCVRKQRRLSVKIKCIDYKGSRCSVCGYNRCIGALEFHHLDPKEKEFQISSERNPSWETLVKELDKCILLCANCHREVEASLITVG